MKKILLATLITSATFFSVSAQAEGGYVGLAFDKANYSVSVVGATTNSSDDKPTGFKIYGGWNYNANFAVEAGYADFGSAKVNFSTNAGNGSAEAKVNAFYLAGKGTMPINEQFSAFGKLGVVRNKSDYSGRGLGVTFSGSENKTDLYAAIGVSYAVTKNVAATLELESLGKLGGSGDRVGAVSLGARFSF